MFYEIFVRSFYDSNGDGVGGLRRGDEALGPGKEDSRLKSMPSGCNGGGWMRRGTLSIVGPKLRVWY